MADDRQHFSRTVLIGDGLLLLCALWGLTGSFLSLYGGSGLAGTAALDSCAAGGELFLGCAALFGLIALGAWSLPRFWGAAAGALTALWAVTVWWNWNEAIRGAGVMARDVAALFSSRVGWERVLDYESGLRPAQEAAATQLFLLLALAGLALLLGWAVVRSRRWWVVLLLTLPPLLPGLLADLYPDWLPFMALAACWCVLLLTALCRRAAADRRGNLTLAVFPAVALALALITVIFPREGYTRPGWARAAEDELLNLTSRIPALFSQWDGPFRSTVTYVGAAERANLARAGPLGYTGRTVLLVTSDYGGLMYLRGSSLAVYEDGAWTALPNGTYEAYLAEHELELSPLYFPAMQEQDGSPVYTVTVDNIGAVGSCVYAPYFPLPQDVNESGMLPVEDAYFARRQGQWTHTVTFVDRYPELAPGDYRPGDGSGGGVTLYGSGLYSSTVYVSGGSPAQSAALAYAGYAYDNYLDVPEDLRELLETYAGLALEYPSAGSSLYYSDSSLRIQIAERFAAYLEVICQYDDLASAAPEGTDPVRYFLTESRRGYCMHYASAVTLMLRCVGIPARYVSGFAAEVSPGQRTEVPDRAAHAWVEIWLDGFGWYPVEVTPDDAFAWMERSDVQDPGDFYPDTPEPTPPPTDTPEPTEPPDQPTPSPSGNENEPDGPDDPEQAESGPDLTALFQALRAAFPVTGAFLLIWFIQFAAKRFRAWRMNGSDANRSALVCYRYLCRLERWGGKMDPQAVELAQKARFSQHTLTREELGVLRNMVDRERTRLCVAPGLPKRLVCRYWWGKPRPSPQLTHRVLPKQKK